jgi:hypothetical protein
LSPVEVLNTVACVLKKLWLPPLLLLLLQVQREHHVPAGDFPDVARLRLMRLTLSHMF